MSTVLIVEDDQEIRELIGDVLTLEGFTVHSMARLPHGLDRIRKIEPDVIVLDLGLPGIGGIELMRIIKEDPKLGSIPIVICSGAVDTMQAHRKEFEDPGIPVRPKTVSPRTAFGSGEKPRSHSKRLNRFCKCPTPAHLWWRARQECRVPFSGAFFSPSSL